MVPVSKRSASKPVPLLTTPHWVLDIAFRKDESRVRKDHAPENLAVLRHIALNLPKQEHSAKLGIKATRLKAGWDENYLLKVLAGSNAIALRAPQRVLTQRK